MEYHLKLSSSFALAILQVLHSLRGWWILWDSADREQFHHYRNSIGRVALKQGSASHDPWAKSGRLPLFVNKVLLEHGHAYLFMRLPWLLC